MLSFIYSVLIVPGARFISEWFKEWQYCIDEFDGCSDDYLSHLQKVYGLGTFNQLIQGCDAPSNFKQEIALLKVLYLDRVPTPTGLSALKSPYGPLAAFDLSDWNSWIFACSLFEPLGKTQYLLDSEKSPSRFIYLTPYHLQIIDWIGNFKADIRTMMDPTSFYCTHIVGDPEDCGIDEINFA